MRNTKSVFANSIFSLSIMTNQYPFFFFFSFPSPFLIKHRMYLNTIRSPIRDLRRRCLIRPSLSGSFYCQYFVCIVVKSYWAGHVDTYLGRPAKHIPLTTVCGGHAICLFLSVILQLSVLLYLPSPWYNRTGWLGVKHQLTYLLCIFHRPDITVPVDWE